MKALLVGGPLHGKLIPIEKEALVKVFSKNGESEVYEYIRYSKFPMAGKGWVLFVWGEAEFDLIIDAIQKSDLSDTGKQRVMEGNYTYIKVDDE